MKIDSFSLTLTEPLETAEGPIDTREGFLVTVRAEGERGVGEATTLPGWTESRRTCERALEEARDIATASGPEDALDGMDPQTTPAARHGVALALADAAARASSHPLYSHLGADHDVDHVPVNATIGDANVVQTRAAVERAVEKGFQTVKVKVGARSPEQDRERLWAVREACPGVAIRADANGMWDREAAETAVRTGNVMRLEYLEQPLPAANLDGHMQLREHGTAIALDESLVEAGLGGILEASAADAVVVKPMAVGGPDIAVTIARRAQAAGVTPIVSTTIDGAVARTAAVHVAATIVNAPACGLATGDRIQHDLTTTDPAPVSEGMVAVPQDPGNGPIPTRIDDA